MSKLISPYELTVWDDVWNSETSRFDERKLALIGSDSMDSQARAIEIQLTENTNGTKKLTFKMYKRYIDTETGELVCNPFSELLYNERKIKLYYKNEWYDFIIKNVSEESEKYLCSYQLEDALVQELSKNGFGIVLDAQLQNNSGTAKELATRVLAETDWEIDKESETFVQTVEESLVYIKTTAPIKAIHVLDQKDLTQGVQSGGEVEIAAGELLLGFYSSCTGKPYRFQFIFTDLSSVVVNQDNVIENENCQYYIDIGPETKYSSASTEYTFFLPKEFEIASRQEGGNEVVISTEYRGARYAFIQKSQFIPVLNRYVNVYKNKNNNAEYYGYSTSTYQSNSTCKNLISNPGFKTSSGWLGTKLAESYLGATVSTVYGHFEGSDFVSAITGGTEDNATYLQVIINNTSYDAVINSGPKDNRLNLGNIYTGERWCFDYECYDSDGRPYTGIIPHLGDYTYNNGYYDLDVSTVQFSPFVKDDDDGVLKSQVLRSEYEPGIFQRNAETRLCLTFGKKDTFYIKKVCLYKEVVVPGSATPVRPPLDVDELKQNPVGGIETKYYYFTSKRLENITKEDQLIADEIESTLGYETYIPVFDEQAEKVRSIDAKESNYFNILQSIAETFSGWITFNIQRDRLTGQVQGKKIKFKNYIDQQNPVGFRYGINLKKVQRTFESKQITTKLIVKQNSNEYANHGFCTIARAAANPSGENYIYDFSYFFNQGLMDREEFLKHTYVINNKAKGRDLDPEHELFTLQGYFPRVKNLNVQIDALSEVMSAVAQELVKNTADLEVARAGRISAQSGKEDASFNYKKLCGVSLENAKMGIETATRDDVKRIVEDYINFQSEFDRYSKQEKALEDLVGAIQTAYNTQNKDLEELLACKSELNKLFFQHYSRFILEGTWINEEYVSDEQYYADSLSVMQSSCYPQVAYTVDVIAIDSLPEYQNYSYKLGDTTTIIDEEFFGDSEPVNVIITEITTDLDNPDKNKIKVQNFKNQFQDLFQKITATVQQAQYNSGAYDRAVSLVAGGQEVKSEFLSEALSNISSRLMVAGQQSVTQGANGLMVTNMDSPNEQIHIIGGAIMMSSQDELGRQKWTTAICSDGISANLIKAGVINTGRLTIMNNDVETFRWDAAGITAYWIDKNTVNKDYGIRMDKFGIYGFNVTSLKNSEGKHVDGEGWRPYNLSEIDQYSTFSLTWEGLKVAGDNVIIKIGNGAKANSGDQTLFNVTKGGASVFNIDALGNVFLTGTLTAGSKIGELGIEDFATVTSVEELKKQIDKKAETWYQELDPSYTWDPGTYEQHIGDLWKCTEAIKDDNDNIIRSRNSEWIWSKTGSGEDVFYEWKETEVSDEIFDAIDGKNAIYIEKPSTYSAGDMWIVEQDYRIGDQIVAEGTIVIAVYDMKENFSWGDWAEKVKYTDSSEIKTILKDFGLEEDTTVLTTDFTFSSELIDGKRVTVAKDKDGNTKSTTLFGDGLVFTNVGLGEKDEEEKETYFKISSEGLMEAQNAVIHGTIFANEGRIGGWALKNGKLEKYGTNKTELTQALANGEAFINPAGDSVHTIANTYATNWVMGIGSNFGVTANGAIYATSGKIGTMTIGDIDKIDGRINKAQSAADGAKETADGAKETADDAYDLAESAMQADVDSDYSWQFSTTYGITMWDGDQVVDNEVFSVNSAGLTITGKIHALAGGSIGGWAINADSLSTGDLGLSGGFYLAATGTTDAASIGGSSSTSGWAIAVGEYFGVLTNGTVYAENLQASGGKIGGWTIEKNKLSIPSGGDGTNTVLSIGVTEGEIWLYEASYWRFEFDAVEMNYYDLHPEFRFNATPYNNEVELTGVSGYGDHNASIYYTHDKEWYQYYKNPSGYWIYNDRQGRFAVQADDSVRISGTVQGRIRYSQTIAVRGLTVSDSGFVSIPYGNIGSWNVEDGALQGNGVTLSIEGVEAGGNFASWSKIVSSALKT